MIASVMVPLADIISEPPEMMDDRVALEAPPIPCLGHDACRGSDAGNTYATSVDITSDFDWTGINETNTYYGSMIAVGTTYSADDNYNDFFLIDSPGGYGVEAIVSWNTTGSTYDGRAYRVFMGGTSMLGYSTSTYSYGYSWGYAHNGYGNMGDSAGMSTSGNAGSQYFYEASPSYPHAKEFPINLGNEEMMVGVMCYYCGTMYVNTLDYQVDITVFPADNGVYGDNVQAVSGPELSFDSGADGIGGSSANPAGYPAGTTFSSISDTYTTVTADEEFSVLWTADNWAGESSFQVESPSGIIYYDSLSGISNYETGTSGPYSDATAGAWTITGYDSYGDGGIHLALASVLGSTTGLLTGDNFNLVDSGTGMVGSSDTSDLWAITIPEGLQANISLEWAQNADLDLWVWSDIDKTVLFSYSYFGAPPGEFIDFGPTVTNTTLFVEVDYWSGASSWAGYILTLQLSPSVPPPCNTQNDAGSGLDAADDDTSDPDATPMNLTSMGLTGTIQGMLCDSYDDEDWYQFTVPAYHGMWARMDWTAGEDGEQLGLTQYMQRDGYTYLTGVSYSTSFNPQAVASNDSYSWNLAQEFSTESTVFLRALVSSLPDDVELDYTITWSIYNATTEPLRSVYQNDAGLGVDAHDSSSSRAGANVIPSMNNTLTGYGHDSWDTYDMYEIYIPEGYAMSAELTFPVENDLELYLKYASTPTTTYLSTACSSLSSNPEVCGVDYSRGGQSLYIVVTTDKGSGDYTLEITMITIETQPGATYDDCGTGGDASNDLWTNGGPTWLTNSTAINATGHPDDVGGTCTGWTDYTWDKYDAYNIYVPAGKYMWLNTTWDDDSQGPNSRLYTYILKCTSQTLNPATGICSSNSMTYIAQEWDNDGDASASSGLSLGPNGGWLTLQIYGYPTLQSYGVENLVYTMNIEFDSLLNLDGGIQDDAGSGLDAGADELTAIHVNDFNIMTNNTANSTLFFEGWSHGSVDIRDKFTFDVPADHGYSVLVAHDGVQYNTLGFTTWIVLDILGTGTSTLGYGSPTTGSSNVTWNSSSSNNYYGGEVNTIQIRNWAGATTNDDGQDYNVTITFFTLDIDGDGWYDDIEIACNSDPNDATSVPDDTDADGICDVQDQDTDGDGVVDSEDDFPLDMNETSDNDGDGLGDNSDFDNDNDMWNDTDELDCLTDPYDSTSVPIDFDSDSICDLLDLDDDNDGYEDSIDEFPLNSTEWADNDGDRVGDNLDLDDDNDNFEDLVEIECDSDPMDLTVIPTDLDLDGVCDAIDNDIDGDGYDNDVDAFPEDPSEWADYDGDSIGDNADLDDDNDLVLDVNDAFPMDSYETVDTDGDDVGDNADLNDDGDSWTDAEELACGSNGLDSTSVPNDFDGDMICDKVDTDDDGDGVSDINDAFPYDANENTDLDGDGIGDYSDPDDDGDGWLDSVEPNCGTDPMDAFSVPADNDGDNECDTTDGDDDNDGTIDIDDAFSLDPTEQFDLDGDGFGDNSDQDDDGDGWLDITEIICANANGQGDPRNANVMPIDNETSPGADGVYGTTDDMPEVIIGDGLCNAIDPDDDGDGYLDPVDENDIQPGEDAFKWDPTEQFDNNGDGKGDNGEPLGLLDDMKADPIPFAGVGLAVMALAFLGNKARGGRQEDEFGEDEDFTEEFMEEDDEDLEDLEV